MNKTPEELDAYMARLRKELEAVEQMKAEVVAQEQTISQVEQTTQSEAFAQTYQRYISTQQHSEAFALCLENLKGEDKEQAEKRAKQALELMANGGVRRFALNPKVAISYEKIIDGLLNMGYENLCMQNTLKVGAAEINTYSDGELQQVVCKTRNHRHITTAILAVVLAVMSFWTTFLICDAIDLNMLLYFYTYIPVLVSIDFYVIIKLLKITKSSRRYRKQLLKDVGEIIIKANQ
jgi:hypothetical protein